jgi:hypothetical protein
VYERLSQLQVSIAGAAIEKISHQSVVLHQKSHHDSEYKENTVDDVRFRNLKLHNRVGTVHRSK